MKRLLNTDGWGQNQWRILGCVLALAIGVLDYLTEPQAMLLYFIPIALVAKSGGMKGGVLVACFSAFLIVGIESYESLKLHQAIASIWNPLGDLVIFISFSCALSRMISAQGETEQLRQYLVHDLRSPLTSTVGGLSMIYNLACEREDALEMELAEIGIIGGQRVLRLIDSILDTGRLANGKMPVTLTQISPANLINCAIQQVKFSGRSKSLRFEYEANSHCSDAIADPNLTERMIVNLLGNAIKFSPSKSTIVLRSFEKGGQIIFSVTDLGPGMDEKSAKSVFEKYSQIGGDSEFKGGTGLGLAFCKLAIEAQRGRIWIESEVDKGTTVFFTLPVATKKNERNEIVVERKAEENKAA